MHGMRRLSRSCVRTETQREFRKRIVRKFARGAHIDVQLIPGRPP
jgi:hypothetical protein